MAINPKIKQKAEDIRNKIYGKEVRESLASGIEAISEDVEATIGRQGYVEEQFQDVLDETTGKGVISAPELIAARNGKSNLKTRLDEEHAQVTAQLQQKEQELNAQLAQNDDKAIDIRKLGARLDGVNNDIHYIRQAIEEGYKNIYIPGTGVCLISGTVEIPSNTNIFGDGIGRTIVKLRDDSNTKMFTNLSTANETTKDKNITLSDMTIDGNQANQSGTVLHGVVRFSYAENIVVKNVHAKNGMGTGITVEHVDHFLFEVCLSSGNRDDGFSAGWLSKNGTLRRCKAFENVVSNGTNNQNGIEVEDGASNVTLIDCESRDNTVNYEIKNHTGWEGRPRVENVKVIGCRSIFTTQGGNFHMSVLGDGCDGLSVRDFETIGYGQYISLQNIENTTIDGIHLKPIEINSAETAYGILIQARDGGEVDSVVMNNISIEDTANWGIIIRSAGTERIGKVSLNNVFAKNNGHNTASSDIIRCGIRVQNVETLSLSNIQAISEDDIQRRGISLHSTVGDVTLSSAILKGHNQNLQFDEGVNLVESAVIK
ncbi:glycosyl hydrolase family 28-related protein [Jeotgalibaca porci]|uniref:glycosyl hydrolase family 28-related protein n=1 Tax=Jeotgalibaca porci TaxID=1868793 RepID=UPI003F931AFF